MVKKTFIIIFLFSVLNCSIAGSKTEMISSSLLVKFIVNNKISLKKKKVAIKLFKKKHQFLSKTDTDTLLSFLLNCSDDEVIALSSDILSIIPIDYSSGKIYKIFVNSATKRVKTSCEAAGLIYSLAWTVASGRIVEYERNEGKIEPVVSSSDEKLMIDEVHKITDLLKKKSSVIPYINFELIGLVMDEVIESSDSFSYTNQMIIKVFTLFQSAPESLRKRFYGVLNYSPGTFGLFSTSFLTTDLIKFLINEALSEKNSDIQLLIKEVLLHYCIPNDKNDNLKVWWDKHKNNFSVAQYFLDILMSDKIQADREKMIILEVFSFLYQYNLVFKFQVQLI